MLDNTQKSRVEVAYVNVARPLVEQVLDFLADQYDFELTTNRDAEFVIYSCGGLDVLNYEGVRIFITGENISPNFAICDYAMAFDKMDFGDRYLWWPLSRWNELQHRMLLTDRRDPAKVLATKSGFCSYVMSNMTDSDDARTRIFELFSKYKTVNSGGLWRNNVGGRVSDKRSFQSAHKFALAIENCSYPGYITEKFIDAALADTIPIYWGDPHVADYFNTKAFINCHDYDSLKEVVDRVREIDNDDKLYMQMLREPWFKDGVEPECFRKQAITSFLHGIFGQAPEKAFRRNRGRWGIKYEKNLYDMHFRPHVQCYKRLRANWRQLYHKLMPYRKPY